MAAAPSAPLRAAADACPEAVIVADDRARIVLVNEAAASLCGCPMRELLAQTVWDITDATSQIDFDPLWKEFLRSGRQRGTYHLKRKDGSAVEVAYCAEAHVLPHQHVSVLAPA